MYSSQMDSARLYRDVTVTVSLSRTDLVEEQTVFFQVYGPAQKRGRWMARLFLDERRLLGTGSGCPRAG